MDSLLLLLPVLLRGLLRGRFGLLVLHYQCSCRPHHHLHRTQLLRHHIPLRPGVLPSLPSSQPFSNPCPERPYKSFELFRVPCCEYHFSCCLQHQGYARRSERTAPLPSLPPSFPPSFLLASQGEIREGEAVGGRGERGREGRREGGELEECNGPGMVLF